MTHRIRPLASATLFIAIAWLAALPAAAQIQPAPVCLYAFSKDLCNANLTGPNWSLPICTVGGGIGCNNLVGLDATFRGPITATAGVCGDFIDPLVPCDEAPSFGGELVATVGVRTQRHTNCKARGSWDGSFRIVSHGVSIATGNLVATMGMGTHREACENASCSQRCEVCHDARFNGTGWDIGSEGTLKGRVQAGPYAGCSFTASFQGDFAANGDTRGPLAPLPAWSFCGTLEGVLECPCTVVPPPS